MATVKVGQIKSTVSKAVAYIVRDDATRGGLYVSTNAAVLDSSDHVAIAAQFAATRERFGVQERKGEVLAHHVIQAFDPRDKMTPEQAHRLGVELAERITEGKHEYVISTHLDKDHVHNHLIFNATSLETGRKYRMGRERVGQYRAISDELCKREGLRVLPPFRRACGFTMNEMYAAIKGKSWKQYFRTEIDKAASRATTWEQFEALLERAGIEVKRQGMGVTYYDIRPHTKPNRSRDFNLGEAFTQAAIMARLSHDVVNRIDFDQCMIVRRMDDGFVVRVPGTKGQMYLTVPYDQVVQHGRTYRAYIPASMKHALTDREGNLVQRVATGALYEWFATPREVLARERGGRPLPKHGQIDLASVRGWRESLAALHALEDRVNARARWLSGQGVSVPEALAAARVELHTKRREFQSQLVAFTDQLDNHALSKPELNALKARLRELDRDLARLTRDVDVLTYLASEYQQQNEPSLTAPREAPKLSERIEDRARRQRRAVERTNEARAADVQADDPDRDGDLGRRSLFAHDDLQPEEPTKRNTLQERIEAAAARRTTRPTGDGDDRRRGAR